MQAHKPPSTASQLYSSPASQQYALIYGRLSLPFRFLLEATGLALAADVAALHGDLIKTMQSLDQQPLSKTVCSLQALQDKLSWVQATPGLGLRVQHVIQQLFAEGPGCWLQWCPSRGYKYSYEAVQTGTPGDAGLPGGVTCKPGVLMASLHLDPEGGNPRLSWGLTLEHHQQGTSCYLSRHWLNNHHRLLAIKCPSGAELRAGGGQHKSWSAAAYFSEPHTFLGRSYKFLCAKEDLVYLYATHTHCPGDTLTREGFTADSSSSMGGLQCMNAFSFACQQRQLRQPSIKQEAQEQQQFSGSRKSVDPSGTGVFEPLDVDLAHKALCCSNTEIKPGKAAARVELCLTPSLEPFRGTEVQLYYSDDISPGAGDLMTDGAGLISLDLAAACPAIQHGIYRGAQTGLSIMQVRIVDQRVWPPLLAKGTLTPCAELPPNCIIIPFSMVKLPPVGEAAGLFTPFKTVSINASHPVQLYSINPEPTRLILARYLTSRAPDHAQLVAAWRAAGVDIAREVQHARVLVSNTCFAQQRAFTNAECIKLLTAGGVPEQFFVELMQRQVDAVGLIGKDVELSIQAAEATGLHGLAADLMRAGWGCASTAGQGLVFDKPDAFLLDQLNKVRKTQAQSLLKLRFRLDDSFRLVGVPDWSASIPEGCVVVVLEGRAQMCEQQVLLRRDPGLHPSDVRKVRQVKPPDAFMRFYFKQTPAGLSTGMYSAVVFSTRGKKSLAALLAGGDFDGDEFLLCAHHFIVTSFNDFKLRPEEAKAELCSAARTALPDETQTLPSPGSDDLVLQHKGLYQRVSDLGSWPLGAVAHAAKSASVAVVTLVSGASARAVQGVSKVSAGSSVLRTVKTEAGVADAGSQGTAAEERLVKLLMRKRVSWSEAVGELDLQQQRQIAKGMTHKSWQAASCVHPPQDPRCVLLADMMARALDSQKTGDLVSLQEINKASLRKGDKRYCPDFISKPEDWVTAGFARGPPGASLHDRLAHMVPAVRCGTDELYSAAHYELDHDLSCLYDSWCCDQQQGVREQGAREAVTQWKSKWSSFLRRSKEPAQDGVQKKLVGSHAQHAIHAYLRWCPGPEFDPAAAHEVDKRALTLYHQVYRQAQQDVRQAGRPARAHTRPPSLAPVWLTHVGEVLVRLKANAFHNGLLQWSFKPCKQLGRSGGLGQELVFNPAGPDADSDP